MAAAHTNHINGMMACFSRDASLVSPLFGNALIRGQADLAVVLAAVYGSLTDLEWTHVTGTGFTWAVVAHARIGGVNIDDAMIITVDPAGQIDVIRAHVRPLLGALMLAAYLAPKLLRHPMTIKRSSRR